MTKEAISNPTTELSEYHKVYINSLEFDSYAAAKTTHSSTIKVHKVLEGTRFIHGKEAKVLFDTGTIGTNLISAAFVTTHCIPCMEMKETTKRFMAKK